MMKRTATICGGVVIAVFAVAVLSGCGDVECGEGTIEVDGGCVVEVNCGANTVLDDEQGVCIAAEPVDCGEETELEPMENRCVPTNEVCGQDTAYSSEHKTCMATDEVCAAGTYFDDQTRLCYPSQQCQPGDRVIDGTCATEVEYRIDRADYVADEITDPAFGGEPVVVPVQEYDQEVDFTGTIGEPADLNGDGALDQRVDVFVVEALAGDVLEVSVRSVHWASPAFRISGIEAEGVERFSADVPTHTASRQILVPIDGTYLIEVAVGEAIHGEGHHPVGDENWDYLGTVQRLAGPDPQVYDFDASGIFSGVFGDMEDNYLVIENLSPGPAEVLKMVWLQWPPELEPTVMAAGPPGEYVGDFDGDEAFVDIPSTGTLYLLPDWRTRTATVDLSFEVVGWQITYLRPEATYDTAFDADAHDGVLISFDHDGTGSAQVRVTDESGEGVTEQNLAPDDELQLVGLADGEYTVEYTNVSAGGEAYPHFKPQNEVVSPTTEAVFDADAGELVEVVQSNDNDAAVHIAVVHDDSDEVVVSARLEPDEPLEFVAGDDDGKGYSVYFYEFEPVSGLTITTSLS